MLIIIQCLYRLQIPAKHLFFFDSFLLYRWAKWVNRRWMCVSDSLLVQSWPPAMRFSREKKKAADAQIQAALTCLVHFEAASAQLESVCAARRHWIKPTPTLWNTLIALINLFDVSGSWEFRTQIHAVWGQVCTLRQPGSELWHWSSQKSLNKT